jgi:hypothetical protein
LSIFYLCTFGTNVLCTIFIYINDIASFWISIGRYKFCSGLGFTGDPVGPVGPVAPVAPGGRLNCGKVRFTGAPIPVGPVGPVDLWHRVEH